MTQTLHAVGGADGQKARTNANILGVVRMITSAYDVEPEDLAALLGISRATVYLRLKGRSAFNPGEIAIMSEHFGVPLDRLFAGPDAALGRTPEAGQETNSGWFATSGQESAELVRAA
jgi:transcriptional regulator with XRE-family HTH domain